MILQFSQQELEAIRTYFNKIYSGETQKQAQGGYRDFPEWNTVFLLLRKLLAYGIYYAVQTDPDLSYKELQTRTQKPKDMLVNVHAHLAKFENLLVAYTTRSVV